MRRQTDSKKKKTGLFWRTLISYASVLLLPIIICSFYYFHSYNALKERTIASQHLMLENSGEQINSVFRDAITLGSHIQLNKYVVALANSKSTPGSTPVMDRYYLKKDLAAMQISNALIQRINLYFPDSGYIVNPVSTFEKSLLPAMEAKSNTMTDGDWDAIGSALQENRIICYANREKNFIVIAQNLLTDITGKPLAVLCIQIDNKSLLTRLQSRLLLEYSCAFALVDQEQLLLVAGSKDDSLSALPIAEIASYFTDRPDASFYETKNQGKVIIDYYPLQISGTALISITEKKDYQAQMIRLLEIMLLTILICIFTGLVVIMYYSRKNYEPVSQILQFIGDTDESVGPAQNEYHLIMKILTENRNEIARQKMMLKNNYLQKIFSGEIEFSQIPEQVAEQFSFNLSFPTVCVVLLSVEGTGSLNEPEGLAGLTAFTIENVFQELLSPQFPDSHFGIRKGKISVLIPVSGQLDRPLVQIEQLTERLIGFLSDTFQLSLKAGISSLQSQEKIPEACLQADTALEYQRLFETGRICLYETIPQKQIIGSIPLNTSEYIVNLVTTCNQAQITEYFNDIEKNLEKCELSWADAKSCYYFFYQATVKLRLYCQTHYGLQPESLSFLDESFFSQSLPKALSQTCHAYLAACREIAENCKNPSYGQWGKDICRFIDNNYFDVNINLNTIAEHFQITPSYLSRKFREQYQKSVIDYLYEVRISNAVSLLNETDLKIADIAQMTGFVDSNAFIRIFKKLKGTTPGKYKEGILQGN